MCSLTYETYYGCYTPTVQFNKNSTVIFHHPCSQILNLNIRTDLVLETETTENQVLVPFFLVKLNELSKLKNISF